MANESSISPINLMKHLIALILFNLALCAASSQASGVSKPNIVIILIDDMGYGDIAPFGATKQRTPNLDRMASEGMKLTSFYAAPLCSVSRAQLMTGCYGPRISIPGVFGPGSKYGLNPTEHTIAERLKEYGYATACIGKWHLGDQPEFLPTRQGFDHYFGIPYSNDMERKSVQTGQYVVPLMRENTVTELLTDEGQTRIVERCTDEAISFMRANANGPFLLYLPHTAVHKPLNPGRAFRGKSSNGLYGDWVEETDWSVGRIIDTIRELKIDQRTLVIFTSDNGPWLGGSGSDGMGSAGPLRGGKGSTWEGGLREPALAWWPGKIAPGSVCDAVAGTIDLLPTAVKLAGGVVPDKPVIDGRDISPLLFGETIRSPREAHYYFSEFDLQAVRQGPWKLFVNDPSRGGDTPQLYNLDKDKGEKTNIADKNPEVVASLQKLATRMNTEIGGYNPTSRRPAGFVSNPHTVYAIDDSERLSAKANKVAPPASLDKMSPGDAISSAAAPQVAGRGFSISCDVLTTQRDAVLLAHGGMSSGYALYLKAGKVVFIVRTGGGDAFAELSAAAVMGETMHVSAILSANATMTLKVGKQAVVTGRAGGLIKRQPTEEFSLGHDRGKPVAAYTTNQAFSGKITHLSITTP